MLHQESSNTTYQIYVASLTDYNNAILHGKWIELEGKSEEEILSAIVEMLKESPSAEKYGDIAEEWAIHDFELEGVQISEYESLSTIVTLVEALIEHGEAFAIYYNISSDLGEAVEKFEESYRGKYDSLLDYATELFDEVYADSIPENLRSYIDYEAFARDLGFDGYHFESGYMFGPV